MNPANSNARQYKAQGSTASALGRASESTLAAYLGGLGYTYTKTPPRIRNIDSMIGHLKCIKATRAFTTQAKLVLNAYGKPWKTDFFLWDIEMWPLGMVVEIKGQRVSGSIDEKLPFVVKSLASLQIPSALLIEGDGFRQDATAWSMRQETAKFKVFRQCHHLRDYIAGTKTSYRKTLPVTSAPAVRAYAYDLFGGAA